MKNLLLLRDALNISQSELANKLGISQGYYSEIESGKKTNISKSILELLCLNLNTTESWLSKNHGWAYNPSTSLDALNFIERQTQNQTTEKIVVLSYKDDSFGTPRGFIFFKHDSALPMSGSSTRSGYTGAGPRTYKEALQLINERKIKIGFINLDDDACDKIPKTNLANFTRFAKFDKKTVEGELKEAGLFKFEDAINYDMFPDENLIKKLTLWGISNISDNELILLKKIRSSNIDIYNLIKYIDNISK